MVTCIVKDSEKECISDPLIYIIGFSTIPFIICIVYCIIECICNRKRRLRKEYLDRLYNENI